MPMIIDDSERVSTASHSAAPHLAEAGREINLRLRNGIGMSVWVAGLSCSRTVGHGGKIEGQKVCRQPAT